VLFTEIDLQKWEKTVKQYAVDKKDVSVSAKFIKKWLFVTISEETAHKCWILIKLM